MKVFITGGAGFIGSKLTKDLLKNGYVVMSVDNFNNYYSPELKFARVSQLISPCGGQVINMDLLDLEKLNTLVSEFKPNCVIHLAAQAGVRIPLQNYFMYTNSNINGFNNILSCILENNIENFLYASSSSVYGNSSSIPFSESSLNLVPESFYGITKLSNELLASIHTRNSKLKSRGLRLFTVYGPWGRPDMAYFKLFSAAFNQSTFNLYGDGSVQRDFTYIDDVTLIIEKLLLDLELKPHGFNDIVNIGGGRPLSLNYLIEEIKTITGKNIIINRLDHSNSDSLTTIASKEYLEKIVGFHNFVPLEVGLKKFEYWASDPLVQKSMKSWIDL